MKLEPKYLAPFLPHEVIVVATSEKFKELNGIGELCSLSTKSVYESTDVLIDGDLRLFHLDEVKPILHPLSDLAKEIEHNGEKFVPIEKLRELYHKTSKINSGGPSLTTTLVFEENEFSIKVEDNYYTSDYDTIYNEEIGCNLSVKIYNKLHEWHFDTEELIEKGLAIDVNTLTENPYK